MNAVVHHAILMVFVLTSLDLSSVHVTKDTLEMDLFVLVQKITSYNVVLLPCSLDKIQAGLSVLQN